MPPNEEQAVKRSTARMSNVPDQVNMLSCAQPALHKPTLSRCKASRKYESANLRAPCVRAALTAAVLTHNSGNFPTNVEIVQHGERSRRRLRSAALRITLNSAKMQRMWPIATQRKTLLRSAGWIRQLRKPQVAGSKIKQPL